MTFKDVMEGYQKTVEAYLQTLFAEDAPQKQLFDAMRYSLLAGGKRIRPILVLEFCRICGGETEKALPFAAAIEMVHTYSLIHDDLPCMDNDDYRRGRLTNHKVFGEANAVLAGDALLTAAFGQLARAELPAERIGKAVALLSQRAGECGMVGGQVLDLAGEQLVLTEEEIYNVHRLKTGALISAACQLGVIAAGGTQEQLDAADRYAEALGLAFQTRDDMLDVLGDAGKTKAAKDISLRRKPVYQGDLDDIEMYFMATVKEIKKGIGSHYAEQEAMSKKVAEKMFNELTKGQDIQHPTITAEQLADAMLDSVSGMEGATPEALEQLRNGLLGILQSAAEQENAHEADE